MPIVVTKEKWTCLHPYRNERGAVGGVNVGLGTRQIVTETYSGSVFVLQTVGGVGIRAREECALS